jgi:1-acyl-sn-glycerol-3-phosphate acyltransferase
MAKREAGQLYAVAKLTLRPFFAFAWRVQAEGLEHVPAEGPAVLCPNHITYVGKAEYLDSWKTKHLFPALGMIPIDRSGGDSAQAALDAASRVLQRGELFGIYPEGTRSRDGALYKGHTGAARLALRNRCPILPVGIIGTDRIQPPDTAMPRPFLTAQIKIGRPLDLSRYWDREGDRMVLRQITDEVMFEIRELTGQEYRDVYATKKPEAIPREKTSVMTAPAPAPDAPEGHAGGNGDGRRSSADVLRSATGT